MMTSRCCVMLIVVLIITTTQQTTHIFSVLKGKTYFLVIPRVFVVNEPPPATSTEVPFVIQKRFEEDEPKETVLSSFTTSQTPVTTVRYNFEETIPTAEFPLYSKQTTKGPISEINFVNTLTTTTEKLTDVDNIQPTTTPSIKTTKSSLSTEGFRVSDGAYQTKFTETTNFPLIRKQSIDITPPTSELNFVNKPTPTTEGLSVVTETIQSTITSTIKPIESTSSAERLPSSDSPQSNETIPIKNTSTEETTESVQTPTPSSIPTIETIPSNCRTPIGKVGVCKNVFQCNSLLNLLKQKILLEEHKLYLRQSQCGRENETILVCCPDDVEVDLPPKKSPNWSLLPQPRKCGNINENRLYGGYNTEIDSYRYLALLEYSTGGNEKGFYCGGALINDRYILTAAHCVTALPDTWSLQSVRLGEWDLLTDMDCVTTYSHLVDCADPAIDVPIEEVIPHNAYEPTSRNKLNDIALIRLATKVNRTDFIEPICLPQIDQHILHGFDEQSLDLVGWGVRPAGIWNNFKQRATGFVKASNKCNEKYAESNIMLQPSQFCLEAQLRNDTCRIDSGGPVISFDTANKGLGSYYLAGIQSFGLSPCWAEDVPGVFTRVGEFIEWILENIRE